MSLPKHEPVEATAKPSPFDKLRVRECVRARTQQSLMLSLSKHEPAEA
jgi:hypothetical protein